MRKNLGNVEFNPDHCRGCHKHTSSGSGGGGGPSPPPLLKLVKKRWLPHCAVSFASHRPPPHLGQISGSATAYCKFKFSFSISGYDRLKELLTESGLESVALIQDILDTEEKMREINEGSCSCILCIIFNVHSTIH